MPSIPKNLKLHIAKSGLTINEFCDLADVSKGTFFNILKKQKDVPSAHVTSRPARMRHPSFHALVTHGRNPRSIENIAIN